MTVHLKRRNGPSTRRLWTVLRFSNSRGRAGSGCNPSALTLAIAARTCSPGLADPLSRTVSSGLLIDLNRRVSGDLHEVFASPQRMDVSCEHLDGHRIEAVLPGRHDPVARRADLPHDLLARAAVEPDGIGEIGRPERAVAAPLRTVAQRAVVGEELRAGRARPCLARQAEHVIGDLAD